MIDVSRAVKRGSGAGSPADLGPIDAADEAVKSRACCPARCRREAGRVDVVEPVALPRVDGGARTDQWWVALDDRLPPASEDNWRCVLCRQARVRRRHSQSGEACGSSTAPVRSGRSPSPAPAAGSSRLHPPQRPAQGPGLAPDLPSAPPTIGRPFDGTRPAGIPAEDSAWPAPTCAGSAAAP